MVFILHRIRIDNALKTLVDDTNLKLHTAMKDMGITYVPFILRYDNRNVKTGLYKRAVKSIKIDLDGDFLKSYFARKMSFEQWLSKNHNTVAREHYRFLNGMKPDDHERIDYYRKQFESKVPISDRALTFKDQTALSGSVVGHVKEDSQHGKHRWQAYSGADVDKFIDNEKYLFSNNMRLFLVSQDAEGRIKEVLKGVLTEFRQTLMNMDLSEIANVDDPNVDPKDEPDYQVYLQKKRAGAGATTTAQIEKLYKPNKEWFEKLTGEKQTWNQSRPVKFPSIPNILDWFKRTGMYKSLKYDEFLNKKTVKGRMNWIDRSVFLLANGVYAKRLGQSTTFASGKVKQTAGAKIPLSKARKYKRYSKDREKYQTERQLKIAATRADIRKFAAGYRNSKAVYSRVNRKRGNTSRMDKREDNRV
jgi:hypothetical protein